MSADLFAAFNSASQAPPQTQRPSGQTAGGGVPSSGGDPFSFLSAAPSQPQQSQQAQHSLQPQTLGWNPQPWTQGQPGGSSTWEPTTAAEEDDGWGDFEVAAPQSTASVTNTTSVIKTAPSAVTSASKSPPRTRTTRAPTLDLATNSLVDVDGPKPALGGSLGGRPQPKPANPDPNVLFDADDFDGQPPEDDEFGDFETGEVPQQQQQQQQQQQTQPPAVDLLSSSATFSHQPSAYTAGNAPPSQLLSSLVTEGPSPYPKAPRSPSLHLRNPFPGLGVATPKATGFPPPKPASPVTASPITAWPSMSGKTGQDAAQKRNSLEDWGTFQDFPSVEGKPKPPAIKTTKPAKTAPATQPPASSDWDWDAWGGDGADDISTTPKPSLPVGKTATEAAGPPPTNVPPPSILLSLFPQLLGSANTHLFKPTGSRPAAVRDRVLSDPATAEFLRGYLALATVAGRIMAGRKLRWQRDKFLSQGMAISAAGGKRGMKLSGVDRAQAGHEEREAADVVAAWKEVVGRLRTAVAAANNHSSQEGARLKVPELADGLAVRTAKGALTAPKACVVCGLRRDERVARLDVEVEDSFGEWWVEFWGHRACRNFWLEHEAMLRQR